MRLTKAAFVAAIIASTLTVGAHTAAAQPTNGPITHEVCACFMTFMMDNPEVMRMHHQLMHTYPELAQAHRQAMGQLCSKDQMMHMHHQMGHGEMM
ncbi:hypothetical protein IEU95_08110 [Hoyosella rhizosphaerae]|uniref:DUF305 domain-containing protein n=1 Tax=Hoyosella rhizosphaerae TaxID=1755582 RepID=A0A916U2U5_9ACTN|nr:hypothetical protein [Hoyosella rhizosphaerae]MBN4926791.1 hypothetical protein [Hoyosella rhizosphaerae]GGC56423.1 hypothetical protein GCM10011410_06130 [Hoyosella rhizosphaerae]